MGRKTLLILSIISGMLLSVPWLIPSFSWILFLAFVPLLVVEDLLVSKKQSSSAIFFYAFIAFFIWNVLSTWWIAYVSLSGMIIIAALNSMLMACIWWLMHLVHRKTSSSTGYFSLIVFWLAFEFLHFNWSVQWPWLTLGNGFSSAGKMIQWYEFTGVLGGSLWILLVNILIYATCQSFAKRRVFKSIQLFVWLLVLITLPTGWSLYLYYSYSETGKTTEVVVLQPNIDPFSEKFSGMSDGEQSNRLISLAETIVTNSTEYVLAPETALPPIWEEKGMKQNHALRIIDSLICNFPQLKFVVGAVTQKKLDANQPVSYTSRQLDDGSFYDVFNSALLIDSSSVVKVAHKSLLVSGVEKMPFQKYFSFVAKYIVHLGGVAGSFTPASQSTVFIGPKDEKIGAVICFESVFGGYVSGTVKNGANLIFVLTNDGWFKDSPGVWQHFSYSRLRAIETRRYVVRSANTGVSGIINGRGDVVEKTKVNSQAVIRSDINLNNTITFYVRYGDYIGRISLILSVSILIYLLLFGGGQKKSALIRL